MNEIVLSQMQYQASRARSGDPGQAVHTALRKYRDALLRARLRQAWSVLTGQSRRLLDLEDVRTACAIRGRHYAGARSVPIDKIRGSEGRSTDFDTDFQPLKEHAKGRWLSIAAAREQGVALPVVDLIQIGDLYFVRDGHHRISVARAWGQETIDAEVTVWEVVGPLPWEKRTIVAQAAARPA